MRPALQRRRRHLLTRRIQHQRAASRNGVMTLAIAFFLVAGLMFTGSVVGTAGGVMTAYSHFSADLPDPRRILDIEMPQSTYVYDRTGGRLLARFECENRESVGFDQLPEHVVNATIAAEDRTFWENDGVDYAAVARAALANLEAGQVVQGASTITQQVIKYAGSIQEAGQPELLDPDATPAPAEAEVDPDDDAVTTEEEQELIEQEICRPPELTFLAGRGYGDKVREQILARQVTEAHPGRDGKERMLTTYLNLIFYGNNSYGIRAAAANYFGIRDLNELTLAQAAFLAGLPQRPSAYDPYFGGQGPELALARRDIVLRAMREEGYITAAQFREASTTTWEEMNPSRASSLLLEPQFTFRVQREAEQILEAMGVAEPELAVRTGGYRIVTTLDYDLQQMAKDEVARWVADLADKNVHNGALVAMDSNTGEIVAYIGSVDYYNRDDPRVQGQFDVAGLGLRQSGSAFKPITYSTAFASRQATVATFLVDGLTEFGQGEHSYRPRNADRTEHGPMLAVDALRYSLNIPSVMMQYIAGVDETARLAEEMGVASHEYLMSLDPNLTLTLGTVPTRLVNMTQAYGAFAQEGVVRPARTIKEIRDRHGRLVYELESDGPQARRALEPAVAYLTHSILESNTDPARNIFWGRRARLDDPAGNRREAGFKTGTTDNFRDVSGYGYLPGSLVTGVWMGNNNMEPLVSTFGEGLFAADGPLLLWQSFMSRAVNEPWEWNGHQPVPQTTFARPANVVTVPVCRWSGMGATGNCGPVIELPFIDGTQPPPDNVHRNGCLDVIAHLRQNDRPDSLIEAAETLVERVATDDRGARGNPDDRRTDPDSVQYAINPLYGEDSLPSMCRPPG